MGREQAVDSARNHTQIRSRNHWQWDREEAVVALRNHSQKEQADAAAGMVGVDTAAAVQMLAAADRTHLHWEQHAQAVDTAAENAAVATD